MIDVGKLIQRLTAFDWYAELILDERDIDAELASTPTACDYVTDILDELDKPGSPWRALTDKQMKMHVLRVIKQEVAKSKLREGLNELEWYCDLDHNEQKEVLKTTLSMLSIAAATPRPARDVNEEEINAANPWSRLFQPRPAIVQRSVAAPLRQTQVRSPRRRRSSAARKRSRP